MVDNQEGDPMREKFRKTQGSPSRGPRLTRTAAAGQAETAALPRHTDSGAAVRQHGTARPVPFLPAAAGRATPEKAAQEREERRQPNPHRSPRAGGPKGKAAWRRPLQPSGCPRRARPLPFSTDSISGSGTRHRSNFLRAAPRRLRGAAGLCRACAVLPGHRLRLEWELWREG